MNHKLSGLEQVCLLAVLSIRSPACISRSQEQGWFLSGGSRRESLFLPRSPSRGCPQPLLPSFQPSRALLIIVLPSRHFSFSWSPLPLPFSLDIWIPSVVRLCHSVPNYVRSGVSAFQLEHYEWGNSDKDEERERERVEKSGARSQKQRQVWAMSKGQRMQHQEVCPVGLSFLSW